MEICNTCPSISQEDLRGAVIPLIVALLVNNISKNRKYPEYWL